MIIKNTRDTMSQVYFDALKIRNTVFVKEQGVPYSLEMASPKDEAMSVHFVFYNDEGKACATVRLLMDEVHENVTLQRMAVLKEERGKGYAAQLLNELLDFSKKHQFHKITLHAQLTARGLYAKFGFTEEGEIFEEAGIKHITMTQSFK